MQTATTAINPLVTFPERAVKPTHRARCRNMPSKHLCDVVIENKTEQFDQQSDALDEAIVEYWNERSDGYSCCVCEELVGSTYRNWYQLFHDKLDGLVARTNTQQRQPRALDLGCGPGFFSIVLARMGCAVDAVDSSAGMLEKARQNNIAAHTFNQVSFHEGDVAILPFKDNSFDVIALRNVTWLMRDPEAAYREWKRVLAPGGKLLVFDANWYSYLVNPEIDAQRVQDESAVEFSRQEVNGFASDEQERHCEVIARALPSTYLQRPMWDVQMLNKLGYSDVSSDESVWKVLWNEEEQEFYRSSPLFLIEATKE